MVNAVRLSSKSNDLDKNHISIGVIATLLVPFIFEKLDGHEVQLEAGTKIHVDEDRGIGSFGDDYFEIDPNDYVISFLN